MTTALAEDVAPASVLREGRRRRRFAVAAIWRTLATGRPRPGKLRKAGWHEPSDPGRGLSARDRGRCAAASRNCKAKTNRPAGDSRYFRSVGGRAGWP